MGRIARSPEYENWLENVKAGGGEFSWIIREREWPQNTSVKARPVRKTADQIKYDVINSPRVQETIKELAFERKCHPKLVLKEAEENLKVMAHDINMSSVKVIGYSLTKVITRIFEGIYVNFDQLRRIRELSKSDSIVFIPSHKSYMDFILLSLLCYDQEVTLPAIAAGMDFMNSRLMGEALRRCGAFFIRRSFGSDKLYWAVFTEYVQTHLVNSHRPVEFFVEGTRSRVGKSLFPKYGLMQVMLEPYLRGQVYDLLVVPVAINYDKILEEILYSYELLGFPKPKESTSGLLKARQILNESFGKCFVTFCEPISVREHFGKQLHRSVFVCQPDSQFVLSEREKKEIRKLGHLIVAQHNKNSVLGIWPFAAQAILMLEDGHTPDSLMYSRILSHVRAQLSLMGRLGVSIQIERSVEEDLKAYIRLHENLFALPIDYTSDDFELTLISHAVDKTGVVDKSLMEKAVGRIALTNYANGLMHEVVDVCIVSAILLHTNEHQQSKVYSNFCRLRNLLAHEFVTVPENELQTFSDAIEGMKRAKFVEVFDNQVRILDKEAIEFFEQVLAPFLAVYHVVILEISSSGERFTTQSDVCKLVQKAVGELFTRKAPSVRLSLLSIDTIKNAFATLSQYGILKQKAKNFEVIYGELDKINREISKFTQIDQYYEVKNKL